MSTAKRAIEGKKTPGSRSKSASTFSNKNTSVKLQQPLANGQPTSATLRSIGPVTRSLAAARSAFSTQSATKMAPPPLPPKRAAMAIPELVTRPLMSTVATKINSRLPPASTISTTRNLAPRQSRPLSTLNKLAARLTPLRTKSKQKEVAVSKDSVIGDELDGDINWVAGSEYEFSKDRTFNFPEMERDRRRDLSYLRVSQVLNGYGTTPRSTTPDANELNRVKNTIVFNKKSVQNSQSACLSAKNSPTSTKSLVTQNDVRVTLSQSGSEMSDNGFCEGRNDIDECALYSFAVPQFTEVVTDGASYRRLVDYILALFNSHLKKCEILLENQANLPDAVAEGVRVAVGRTQLLIRKRLTQFNQQLERHLKPIIGEKETTLNDLHGLWSLVDIQIDDIRSCFEDVELSRLSDWQVPAPPKQTLTAASSMPSLRVTHASKANGAATTNTKKQDNQAIKLTTNGVAIKASADETATKDKENLVREKSLAAAKKRQEEMRKRQEFIRAKRAEMAAASSANGGVGGTVEIIVNGSNNGGTNNRAAI